MDVAAASIAQSQGQVQQQANLSIMKKAMDTSEQQGRFMNDMLSDAGARDLQQAAEPHKGASIDLSM